MQESTVRFVDSLNKLERGWKLVRRIADIKGEAIDDIMYGMAHCEHHILHSSDGDINQRCMVWAGEMYDINLESITMECRWMSHAMIKLSMSMIPMANVPVLLSH